MDELPRVHEERERNWVERMYEGWQQVDISPLFKRLYESVKDVIPRTVSVYNLNSYLLETAFERGIDLSRSTITAWAYEDRDLSLNPGNVGSAKNIYKICAILDLDYTQTKKVFEEVFFTQAFCLKRLEELAYYYYLRRNDKNWYHKAENLTKRVRSHQAVDSDAIIEDTSTIFSAISVLDESELESFLLDNIVTFNESNRGITARRTIRSLVEECLPYAHQEYEYELLSIEAKGPAPPRRQPGTTLKNANLSALINIILWYNERSSTHTIATMTSLPTHVRHNFPTGKMLQEMMHFQKAVSGERLRKMIVMLVFYAFFSPIAVRGHHETFIEDINLSTEFTIRCNLLLENSGLPRLCSYNPFDKLFMELAQTSNPVRMLRRVIWKAATETQVRENRKERL